MSGNKVVPVTGGTVTGEPTAEAVNETGSAAPAIPQLKIPMPKKKTNTLSAAQALSMKMAARKISKKLSLQANLRLEQFPDDVDEVIIPMSELSCRQKGMVVFDHMYFTLTLTLLVLISMGFFFAEMFNEELSPAFKWMDNGIIFIFLAETLIRMFLMGPKAYFTSPLCCMDCFVSVVDIALFTIESVNIDASEYLALIRVLRVSRLSKVSRIARLTVKVDSSMGNDERGQTITKDEDGHIFGFNSATLFSVGYMYNLNGTVLAMPEIWVQALIMVILTTALAALTCPLECDPTLNTYDREFDMDGCGACVNSIDPNYGLMFLGIAAFLLGIFAQLLFSSWWSIRVVIQQLFAEVKDTAMMTLSFIRGSDKESTQVRNDVIRWAKLGAYLLEKKIDGKVNFRWAVDKGWLTEGEWDMLEGKDNAFVLPYQWAFDTLCQAREKDLCTEFGGTFDNLLNSFPKQRQLCSDILMILETPMPYIFVHLMTVICKVNLLFTSIACGTVVGQAVKQQQYVQIVIGYIIVILGNMLIEGLLRLHVVLSDPFGDDACDFPWQLMLDDMDSEVELMNKQFGKMNYEVSKSMGLTPGVTPSGTPRLPTLGASPRRSARENLKHNE